MTDPQPPASSGTTPAHTPPAQMSPVPEWDPGVSGRFDATGPATEEKGSRARALGAIGGLVLVVVVFVLKSELRTWLDQLFN
jgi:hypothetical protein